MPTGVTDAEICRNALVTSGIRGSFGLVSFVLPENEFCKNLMSQDTITTVDSEGYDWIGGQKHSLDQDTRLAYRSCQVDLLFA